MEEQKSTVRAVERALDILLCFTDTKELGLTEIASRIALHKSTVFRLLATLEGKGFVVRNPETEKYHLGYRVWELSANLAHSDDLASRLLPEMERLRDLVEETISLYVRDGKERIRIQAVQSNQPVRRVAPIGARMPLYVGASSKILVAYASEALLEELLQDPAWPASIDRATFREQLAETRARGFATSLEEREIGAAALSAPVFNRNGKLVAAVAISGPVHRLTETQMLAYAAPIMEAAKRMGNMVE